MRVLVCGSRHFKDSELMKETLFQNLYPGDTLIHGDAKGADKLAEQLAQPYVVIERYPADWKTYGRAAGPIRNKQMLEEGQPDLVVAFLTEESKGTKNMLEQATQAGVTVKVINI